MLELAEFDDASWRRAAFGTSGLNAAARRPGGRVRNRPRGRDRSARRLSKRSGAGSLAGRARKSGTATASGSAGRTADASRVPATRAVAAAGDDHDHGDHEGWVVEGFVGTPRGRGREAAAAAPRRSRHFVRITCVAHREHEHAIKTQMQTEQTAPHTADTRTHAHTSSACVRVCNRTRTVARREKGRIYKKRRTRTHT